MLYLTEGDYINAGLSALSIIPEADAFTKTGKASKVLGNGIVESGLKHLDNVADGIKKLVKKADDAIEDFLNNIFNPQFQLKEIYTNKN